MKRNYEQIEMKFGFLTEKDLVETKATDETLSMLAEVLEDDQWRSIDRESCGFIGEQMIYDLSTDEQLIERKQEEDEMLNEGIPSIENLEELELWAESYFSTPPVYPFETEDEPKYLTGFLQMYAGERFDRFGRLVPIWKSLKVKITIELSGLLVPENIIARVEKHGFKWTNLLRVIFYGAPLVEIVGSKIYLKQESKDLTPLSEYFPNILVATPDYEETEINTESIYESIAREYEAASFYGELPELNRVSSGHYELTSIRLQELVNEELEGTSFKTLGAEWVKQDARDCSVNSFYGARRFIKALNSDGKEALGKIHSLDVKTLEDVLYLHSRSFAKINDPLVLTQVRACFKRVKALAYKTTHAAALNLIGRINMGERPEVDSVPLESLEKVFDVLWDDIGIKINSEYKEVYYALKSRLRVLRNKARSHK